MDFPALKYQQTMVETDCFSQVVTSGDFYTDNKTKRVGQILAITEPEHHVIIGELAPKVVFFFLEEPTTVLLIKQRDFVECFTFAYAYEDGLKNGKSPEV